MGFKKVHSCSSSANACLSKMASERCWLLQIRVLGLKIPSKNRLLLLLITSMFSYITLRGMLSRKCMADRLWAAFEWFARSSSPSTKSYSRLTFSISWISLINPFVSSFFGIFIASFRMDFFALPKQEVLFQVLLLVFPYMQITISDLGLCFAIPLLLPSTMIVSAPSSLDAGLFSLCRIVLSWI